MDLNDPIAVLLTCADALARAGLRVAAYGGLALAAYGEARETRDADLAVLEHSTELTLQALRGQGLEPSVAFDSMAFGGLTITRITLFPGDAMSGLNVLDTIRPRSERFASDVQARALTGTLRGQPLRVVSPEDFILLKLLSTRDRDLDDAASVLRALGDRLDAKLLEREVANLAAEIAGHPISERWAKVQARGQRPSQA